MHNLQPGDLAVITRQVETVMAGSVVEIKRLWPKGKVFRSSRTGDAITVVEDSYFFGHPSLEGDLVGFAAARFFVPLTGDFKPEEDDLAEYAETSFYDLRTGRQHLLGGRA